MRQARYLSWFITILLAILLPSPAIAWSFYVSPSEVDINNLSPGDNAEFEFSIYNKENESHVYSLNTYIPEKTEIRQGRSLFPDDSWVSLPQKVEVAANSKREITVKVTIPQKQEWAEKEWELWLCIAPDRIERLTVNYYIRLLISTGAETDTTNQLKPIMAITATVLLVYGAYLFYRKVKSVPEE
jgi:uncharacterized membrane protein